MRTPRLQLSHKIALLSTIPIVVLGLVVAQMLRDAFEHRMLEAASSIVAPGSQVMLDLLSAPEDFEHGFPPEKATMIADGLQQYVTSGVIENVRMYGANGTVVYSSDFSEIGERHDVGADVFASLDGSIRAAVVDGADLTPPVPGIGAGKVIRVLVPAQFPGAAAPAGVSEIFIPYGPLADQAAADAREVQAILAVGLGALWLALWKIASRASRTLRRQADENERLALHDTLTGLPNRTLFNAELDQAISRASRVEGRMVAVLLLDLDRFKEVNDSLGHHEGDNLLIAVAHRLRGALRGGDTVARLGGDEFGVVLHDIESMDAAVATAERIAHALDIPVELGDLQVQASASVGISAFPIHGDDAVGLNQRADVAMYTAKAMRSDWAVYDAAIDPNSPHRLALVAQLRAAIDAGELIVHYQPVADLRTGGTIAMEALVRWQHPVRGLIPPGDFIPAAESSGLIRTLTQFVLREAMRRCRTWLDEGADVRVAVNLSARHVQDPRCPQDVLALLAEVGLPPEHLIIEITESAVLGDPTTALAVLTELRSYGVQVALDDFGTGYSSLTQLKDLPVDEIKIDRSFVSRINEDDTTSAIVESIVELGERLDMHVVAEGVEDADVIAHLSNLGCTLAQGYYFSRPLPPEAADEWLRAHATEGSARR